ncbi:hypothetical protein MRX96_032880 [Rhipicephalus microplus]
MRRRRTVKKSFCLLPAGVQSVGREVAKEPLDIFAKEIEAELKVTQPFVAEKHLLPLPCRAPKCSSSLNPSPGRTLSCLLLTRVCCIYGTCVEGVLQRSSVHTFLRRHRHRGESPLPTSTPL